MLVIFGMFVLASSPAIALEDSPISFGLMFGLNVADFSGDVDYSESLLELCGGAFLAYAINDWATIQSEFLYSMKGAEEFGNA